MLSIARILKMRAAILTLAVTGGFAGYATAASVPLPVPNPLSGRVAVDHSATTGSVQPASSKALRTFFNHFEAKDGDKALKAINALTTPTDRKIAYWMVATSSTIKFSHKTYVEAAARVRNWPGDSAMRVRQEKALIEAGQANGFVVGQLSKVPSTDDGKILQIESLIAAGQPEMAAAKLRAYWVSENFDQENEAFILSKFGNLLRSQDHQTRVNRLLYDDRAKAALRLMQFLPVDQIALLKARVAVIRREAKAGDLLKAVPAARQKDAGYYYAVVQYLRRNDEWLKAGQVLNAAPRSQNLLTDPDAWWIERRLVSRKVLEAGNAPLAYEIVSTHAAKSPARRVDAEFHAGWYALRFLKNPSVAEGHFAALRDLSSRPLSQSRAFYWLARTMQDANRPGDAETYYREAARYPQTYYGQLALTKLGYNSVDLPPLPKVSSNARARFEGRLFVQVVKRLNAIGQSGRTGLFYRHLARTLDDPEEILLLVSMSDREEDYQISLQIGKIALGRGVNVPRLAFPLGAIPKQAGISRNDKALVYAIARQESAFNIAAVSRADARGLMQLLPETAERTARDIGIRFDARKLTRDGAYNAKLGSAFLNKLIDRFGGSYILAIAGYNAGPGRSDQWIERFGDPRLNAIDAIDWVEAIPFSETRNYVQRVMENYQVYRHRLDNAPLTILADLNKGIPTQ